MKRRKRWGERSILAWRVLQRGFEGGWSEVEGWMLEWTVNEDDIGIEKKLQRSSTGIEGRVGRLGSEHNFCLVSSFLKAIESIDKTRRCFTWMPFTILSIQISVR